jgi:hypothetical protein
VTASVGLSPFVGLAAPATTWRRGLLDAYRAQLVAVRSPMLLLSPWSGPSQRVRRSTDNVLHDVPFRGEWRDSDDLAAFAGTGSAYVMTDYDQTGSGHDWTQAVAGAQPRVINAGAPELLGGQPAERFGLAPGMGYVSSGVGLAQPFTMIMTWMAVAAAPVTEHTLLGRDGTASSYIYAPNTQVRVQAGVQVIPAGFTQGVPMVFGFVFNGWPGSRAVVNGVPSGNLNVGTDALTALLYLGYNSLIPSRVLNGFLPDLIIMSGALPNADIIKIQRELGAPRGIVIP